LVKNLNENGEGSGVIKKGPKAKNPHSLKRRLFTVIYIFIILTVSDERKKKKRGKWGRGGFRGEGGLPRSGKRSILNIA